VTVPPRPAPVVRVSDPQAPSAPRQVAPVPERPAGEPPSGGRAGRRRAALPLALLVVGLAAGYGVAELRHAQAERVAEAAATGVLDLRLETVQEDGTSAEGVAGGVVVRRDLSVRNVGGRPVEVLSAELVGGPMASRGRGAVLEHGDSWPAVMVGPLTCPGGSPAYAPAGSVLRVRAQTGAGERTTELPVPAPVLEELQRAADRSCGVVPGEEAVRAEPGGYTVEEDRATVDVQVFLRSSAPVDLLRAESGHPGLRVAVRSGGRPPVFPYRLGDGGTWPRVEDAQLGLSELQVVLTVQDCGPFEGAGPTTPLGEGPLVLLGLQVGGEDREVLADVYDPGVLRELVDRAC